MKFILAKIKLDLMENLVKKEDEKLKNYWKA